MTLHEVLNQRIADFAVLYFKLHRFHWFVQGTDFYTLHELYEELYDEATAQLDEFAERLLAIGGSPVATLKGYLEITALSEAGDERDGIAIAHALIADYNTIVDGLKKGIGIAEDAGDHSTADMFISTITDIQKHVWMLKQFVK